MQPPDWKQVWHCGVRNAKNKKLLAFISAIPATMRMNENSQFLVEINFLCVHKKLRSKRLAPVLIKEITRRVNLRGIFQAVYTAGVVLPKPVAPTVAECNQNLGVRTGALPPSLGGVTLKSGAPEWLVSSRQVNTSVVKRQMKSSYQKDLGKDGELPSERPFIAKTGMASTTEDLFDGTTKDTHHIPGYCGHIPASKRNPHVVKHGDAEDPRDKATSLRLYHRHNVPGYTGHQPVNARNDLGERLSGAHPATTAGAAALGLVL